MAGSHAEFDDWLERTLEEAVQDVFGEPQVSPETQVMEIESVGIALLGRNLCGADVDPAESLRQFFH